MRIKFALSACTDCLHYVANGTIPDERPNLVQDIRKFLGAEDMAHLVCGHGDEEEFAWFGCDCCGSGLGGSRHPLAVLTDQPEDVA